MADEHIATYLNDHLAGSVAALELLDQLVEGHSGTPLEQFFTELRADIAADRQELESLMERLNVSESRTRKASAWLAEKFAELKLRLDDPAGGALRLFESLEALSLGIEGKRSLWLALAAVAEEAPALQLLDYDRLTRRAEEQRGRVETKRLETARSALTTSPSKNRDSSNSPSNTRPRCVLQAGVYQPGLFAARHPTEKCRWSSAEHALLSMGQDRRNIRQRLLRKAHTRGPG